MTGRPRVFQISAEGGISQARTAVELMVLKLSEHAETLGIAFEIEEVTALGFAHAIQPAAPGRLLKPMANRVFTGMAEWRVADVMSEAGRLHDHAQVTRIAPLRQRTAQCFADAHTQRAAHN